MGFLSHLIVTMRAMARAFIDHAIELVEKANAGLEVDLLDRDTARGLLEAYARARRLVDFGIAALSRKLDDASEVARVTGTSIGTAKAMVHTGKTMSQSDDLSAALQQGDVFLDQAAEIASAEQSAPGAAARPTAADTRPITCRATTGSTQARSRHGDLG
jgi:hypothetical protein